VRTPGGLDPAGAVVVAAGPWSAAALPPELAPPVRELWGVVVEVRLDAPPRHVLEELGVDALTAAPGAQTRLLSLIPAGGPSSLGSCFEPERPDPEAGTRLGAVRACARPQSPDGRPYLGPVPGVEGLHLATGHGPWGVSLGPGSARRVAAAVLGEPGTIPPELAAGR
jgi:glycine/D-amino acid oxidase-like deaminating enzyme